MRDKNTTKNCPLRQRFGKYLFVCGFFFSIQVEADTKLSQNWIQTFFQARGTDVRFENVKYQAFHSVESLTNASQVTFICPRFLGPNAYLPHKLMIKVQLEILDEATNQVPVSGRRVAPINNSLHSLFSSCRVWLGETLITKSPENYAHKAYIIDLMSFDGFAKYTWLEAQGWFQDVFGPKIENQTSTANQGFENRRRLFLEDAADATSKYATGGIILMGRLHTDLISAECGLVPHLGLKVQLGFSSHEFVLQKPVTDASKYRAVIKNATLFCPVAQINPDAYRQIESKLLKQDAKLYIERSEVTNKSIPLHSTIFVDQLFAGAQLPSRILIGFVQTQNYLGTQTTSPFYFQRKWKKTTPGPGTNADSQTSTNTNSNSSWLRSTSMPAPPAEQSEQLGGIGTHVFVERVSLTLNGEQVDGLEEGNATEISDTANYVRLHLFLGLLTSTTGNNLTFDEFHRGFFFMAYDLSTSSDATEDLVIPAVRQGNLNIQVTTHGHRFFHRGGEEIFFMCTWVINGYRGGDVIGCCSLGEGGGKGGGENFALKRK